MLELVPIVITPIQGQTSVAVGPGVKLNASSDFIGPFPANTTWQIDLTSDSEGAHNLATATKLSQNHQESFQVGTDFLGFSWAWTGATGIPEGAPVFVQAHIFEPGSVLVDSGSAQFPWSIGAAGLALQGTSAGGFTSNDRAILTSIEAWSALDTFVTSLVLEDMGTSAPGGQLAAELPQWRYGIIVRMTQIDPALVAQTPDLDYFVKTLAVVRVFRGSDILARIPIHRSSQIIPFVGNGMVLQIAAVEVTLWAPGLSVEVDFLENCAGQAFLMKLP